MGHGPWVFDGLLKPLRVCESVSVCARARVRAWPVAHRNAHAPRAARTPRATRTARTARARTRARAIDSVAPRGSATEASQREERPARRTQYRTTGPWARAPWEG
eukprot:13340840-Alexandrium_andersonii.AAC.1